MNIKRCACVAAVVVAVCTVAFWYEDKPASEAGDAVREAVAPMSAAVPAASAVATDSLPTALVASNQTATVRGTKPYVLTCERGFGKSLRLAAEALGARTVGVLSRKSLLVEADGAALARLRTDGRFAVEREFLPSDKIAPALAAKIAGGAGDVEVSFVTLSPEDRKLVKGRIAARGGEILKGCLDDGDLFSARLPAGLVAEFASCGDVRWMELFVRPHVMNDVAVEPSAMNVRAAWDVHGLTGLGQVVSTSDSGIDTGDLATLHKDLCSRILVMTNVVDCDMFDGNGHGTHTAGSIVGDGTLSAGYPDGPIRGTAWEAQLYVWFCAKGGTRSIYTPSTCAELFRGDETGSAWDVYIHSASWGSDTEGEYTSKCRSFDEYLWHHADFLPVVSAGNAGRERQTIGSPAAAKNVLTVGATLNLSKGDPGATAYFSSRGPCADGRIKPDVAAPGDPVRSTRSSKVIGDKTPYTPYTSMSGTSMSCPLTAGAVALVRQWLMRDCGFTPDEPPSAALMKAVVTGGAKDALKPTGDQGWGRVDLAETLFPTGRAVKLIDRIPFASGEEFAWVVTTTNDAPLDVQLAWVDYPASESGSQAAARLVIDLDLTVSSLGGDDLHYGNGGTKPDTLNNLESVRLPWAEARQYLVTVSCKDNMLYDFEDGGAAALYIRGAFDPDEVVERKTVRIARPGAEPKEFTRLDKALGEAKDGDVIEILDATYFRERVVLENDYHLTIVATNANPRLSPITRRGGADILVKKGSLFFTNVVFATEATTPVKVAEAGVVKVAGTAVFDDIVSRTPGVVTDRPQGFALVGELESGITVECAGASGAGDPFGVYTCSSAAASNSAPRLVCGNVEARVGDVDGAGFLRWKDAVEDEPVDPAVAVAYVSGSTKVYYRTLDKLFDKYPAGADVVITKSGGRIAKARTLSGVRSISAEADAGEVVVRSEGSAGFTLTDGCKLTVSGVTFEGYRGNGLFVVNGTGAKLTVTNTVFSGIEGTNKWSGAITVLKGDASVTDSVFDNCRATGVYAKNKTLLAKGGAVYLSGSGCSLELNGGSISGCSANNLGGAVYAANGSSVRVRGALTVKGNRSDTNPDADDIFLQSSMATLTLAGPLTGEDAVGVRYGVSGSGKGNAVGKVFAAVAVDVDAPAVTNSAKAFLNDTDPVGVRAEVGDDGTNLLWVVRTPSDRQVDPDDPDVAVRVVKGAETRHYAEPEYAFGWIGANETATVEILKDVEFGADLVVTNGAQVTLMSTNVAPDTLSRSSDVLIRVMPKAALVVTNLVIDGNWEVESSGLVKVDGGTLDLLAGASIFDVYGSADRASGAVSVRNAGTFTMRSGSEIDGCCNYYFNPGSQTGYGGGVLAEDRSTVNLFGGSISWCEANRGGGVFAGTESTVYVSGEPSVTNNLSIGGAVDNVCVADRSKLILVSAFSGAIGYNEGVSGNTNVFGKVSADFIGSAADKQASAHRFTHDLTGDIGMAVDNGAETLLVWGGSLDAEGQYRDGGKTYSLIGANPAVIPLPTGGVFVYDGTEKVGLESGIGYFVVSGNVATVTTNHSAAVKTRPGYVFAGGVTATNVLWTINPAPFDLAKDTDVAFNSCTNVYDGEMKYIYISGTLPAWLKVEYENNGHWKPGTNEVAAIISGANPNYVPNPYVVTNFANLVIIDPNGEYDPHKPTPTPKTVDPWPVAFTSVAKEGDTWVLVATNARQWCWYSLWTGTTPQTNDFVLVDGTSKQWMTADGPITNSVPAESSESVRFWQIRAAPGIVPAP